VIHPAVQAQKATLDSAIATMEGYQGDKITMPESLPDRRGRQSMGPEERQ
jgi:hypothetical protein